MALLLAMGAIAFVGAGCGGDNARRRFGREPGTAGHRPGRAAGQRGRAAGRRGRRQGRGRGREGRQEGREGRRLVRQGRQEGRGRVLRGPGRRQRRPPRPTPRQPTRTRPPRRPRARPSRPTSASREEEVAQAAARRDRAPGPPPGARRFRLGRPARWRGRTTASSIGSVSLPVKVFCWLGWKLPSSVGPPAIGCSAPWPNLGLRPHARAAGRRASQAKRARGRPPRATCGISSSSARA